MILNLLKESLKLNEDINLDEPSLSNNFFNIYEITDREDFNVFTMNGENNVADHYNFSQNNWQQYVASGQVKPFIITSTDNNQECLAMFLLWSEKLYQFIIREGKNINLPLSFESNTDSDNSAYINFINGFENGAVLPLYNILDQYRDFTGFNPDDYIVKGQYIRDGKLYGIFNDLFNLNEERPLDINLNHLNLTSLLPNSINYEYFGSDEDSINIHFYDNLTSISDGAINNNSIDNNLFLFYDGEEDSLPEVFNSIPEDIRRAIRLSDNEEVQQRRAERRAELERQRQAEEERIRQEQEAQDRQVAQEFDDNVETIFSTITADDYQYDPALDYSLSELRRQYNDLTDAQKQFETSHSNLDVAWEVQNKKHAEIYVNNCIQNVFSKINDANYTYNSEFNSLLRNIQNSYDELDDSFRVKVDELGFENMFNAAKEKQQQLKQQSEAERNARLAASGSVLYDDYLIVKINGGEAIITGYKKLRTEDMPQDVVIPDRVNGAKVTKIGKNAFYNYPREIRQLHLPKYLKSISEYAFYNCDIDQLVLPITTNTVPAKNAYMNSIQCALNAFVMRTNMKGSGTSRVVRKTNINRYFTLKDVLNSTYVTTTVRDEN